MVKNTEFEKWTGGATESEIQALTSIVRKRFWLFLLVSLIPFVNFITMGCAIFCYNNLNYLKSRGRSSGNGLVRLVLMCMALLIPPYLIVKLCTKADTLGCKVLGWEFKDSKEIKA